MMNKCDSIAGCESTDIQHSEIYGYLCQDHMDELLEAILELDVTPAEMSTLRNDLTWRPK